MNRFFRLKTRKKCKWLKGNVSLLIILILLASSVIAMLSINQIQRLLTYGNMTFNYFRAFYLAKAWTELWLTEVYNRENWFEQSITWIEEDDDGNIVDIHDIIRENFMWEWNKYEWFRPYFNMEIKSRFKKITNDIKSDNCDGNKIELKGWDWIVLSLFSDNTSNIEDILNPEKWNLDAYKYILSFDDLVWNTIRLWGFSYDNNGNMDYISVQDEKDLSKFMETLWASSFKSWKKQYLTIKNSGTSDISFCLKNQRGENKIPYSHYLIDVQWHYGDMEVWLESIVKKDIPAWSLNVLGLDSSSS